MKLNIFDSHVHSDNSPDGCHSVTYLCEKALEKGVMGFAVTDHFECDVAAEEQYETRLRQSIFEIGVAQATFGRSVRLTRGVELAQGHLYPAAASQALGLTSYDVVLGSVHSLEKGKPLSRVDFNDPAVVVSKVLEQYYQAQYDMVLWGQFDVLAHLGYPERFLWGKYRIPLQDDCCKEMVDAILRQLIADGKGLEVNTFGLRAGLGKPVPERSVLRRYRELGGELVTLGSDAHSADHLAADFDLAMDLLLEVGFRYFTFYSQHKPVMLRIL